jgi:hypothetical protein
VLSYDRSLVEQLPDVLSELHGVLGGPVSHPGIIDLFESLDPAGGTARTLESLPQLLSRFPPIVELLETKAKRETIQTVAKEFKHWTDGRAGDDLASVLTLQKDLGQGKHNPDMERYEPQRSLPTLREYLASVTSAPPSLVERLTRKPFWELRLRAWKALGRIDTEKPSLSVGPRWITEVHYFREILGFGKHIGLDLFSDDPGLVVAGDMHAMPFPDAHFGFVFLKNVVDKSYDIRKLVSEILRVSARDCVVVVDQICGYGSCTPITRTDIQAADNLRMLFKARRDIRTLVCHDIDISGIGDAAKSGARRLNARLAIQVV